MKHIILYAGLLILQSTLSVKAADNDFDSEINRVDVHEVFELIDDYLHDIPLKKEQKEKILQPCKDPASGPSMVCCCIEQLIKKNDSNEKIILKALELFIPINDPVNNQALILDGVGTFLVSRDACALNACLYKYGIKFNQVIAINHTKELLISIILKNILRAEKCLVSPVADKNFGIHLVYRANGKNFVDSECCDTGEPHTAEDKVSYWRTVFKPTIFYENYQITEDNAAKWDIQTLKKSTFTFLLCINQWKKKNSINVPRSVTHHCIIPAIFRSPFVAINNCFSQVENDIISQINGLKELCMSNKNRSKNQDNEIEEYVLTLSNLRQTEPLLMAFFENFKSWYSEQIKNVLIPEINVVKALCEYKKNSDK